MSYIQDLRQAAELETPSRARELWKSFFKKEITQDELNLGVAMHTADSLQDHLPLPYAPADKTIIAYHMGRMDKRLNYDHRFSVVNGDWLQSNQELLTQNRANIEFLDWALNIPGVTKEAKEKIIAAIGKHYENHDAHDWRDHENGRRVQVLDSVAMQSERNRKPRSED